MSAPVHQILCWPVCRCGHRTLWINKISNFTIYSLHRIIFFVLLSHILGFMHIPMQLITYLLTYLLGYLVDVCLYDVMKVQQLSEPRQRRPSKSVLISRHLLQHCPCQELVQVSWRPIVLLAKPRRSSQKTTAGPLQVSQQPLMVLLAKPRQLLWRRTLRQVLRRQRKPNVCIACLFVLYHSS